MLKQKQIIEAVQEACEQDEQVTSCMMYGSFTKGEGDQYSDVEFYIFIDDPSFETFQSKHWVANIAPYDLMFFNEYGTEVVIFSNLIRGEFHFLPASKIEIIKSFKPTGVFPDTNSMFIYDNTGMLREYLDDLGGKGPERLTDENVSFAFHNFVNAWLLGINVMRRGELARSLEVLTYVQKYMLQLLRINEQNVERWLNSTKNLERDLSPEAYEDYTLITARLRKEELEQAYTHALMLADKLRKQLEPHYDFDVDEKMIGKLRDYLSQTE
ncbi:lincosamide nucleotidyltransferase [Brevibacillus sp. AG162]|uniref:nucleotidyltransferase n=1 Tax=Brevibacillus sp. AG162 TaxID=2572910 RepID=UPI00114EE76A|nr:nucleotidyltransferase [Brevibacillus sp. AG162]TQK53437.1 lincosamide nucleotidyltransferase [Brevibacillus sp. AG162]